MFIVEFAVLNLGRLGRNDRPATLCPYVRWDSEGLYIGELIRGGVDCAYGGSCANDGRSEFVNQFVEHDRTFQV